MIEPAGEKSIEEILQDNSVCKSDYSACTGNWKVTDIIKKLVEKQYGAQ
jgi:hypothetical protein